MNELYKVIRNGNKLIVNVIASGLLTNDHVDIEQ